MPGHCGGQADVLEAEAREEVPEAEEFVTGRPRVADPTARCRGGGARGRTMADRQEVPSTS